MGPCGEFRLALCWEPSSLAAGVKAECDAADWLVADVVLKEGY